MIYLANLGANQQLYLENQGKQTIITLVNSSIGQQQSQITNVQTGSWTTPPTLFQNGGNFLLRIDSEEGTLFIELQARGINLLSTPPSLIDAEVIPLEKVAQTQTSSQRSASFEPMKPMKMGNMSMSFNPMEMRIGDMYLRMSDNSKQESSQSQQNFCTQCGNLVKADDRFCGNCGHKLKD